LLAGGKWLRPAEVDKHLSRLKTLDDAADYFAFFIGVFFKDGAVLGFMKALEDDLFGGLRRDAPGVGRRRFDHHGIADWHQFYFLGPPVSFHEFMKAFRRRFFNETSPVLGLILTDVLLAQSLFYTPTAPILRRLILHLLAGFSPPKAVLWRAENRSSFRAKTSDL
jgi:hypothetical protein